jgi:hypothetical protein
MRSQDACSPPFLPLGLLGTSRTYCRKPGFRKDLLSAIR